MSHQTVLANGEVLVYLVVGGFNFAKNMEIEIAKEMQARQDAELLDVQVSGMDTTLFVVLRIRQKGSA